MGKHVTALMVLLIAGCARIPSPTVKPFADNQAWLLVEKLTYSIGQSGISNTVPQGFVTDFASIPKPLWSYLSPHGRYSKAAIVHDYLYWVQDCTREEADNILLIAMKESGVSSAQQKEIYLGVRAGGWYAWDANRKERVNGLPRVIPPEFLQIPDDVTWEEYRKVLVARGVKDPVFPNGSTTYCQVGKSTSVPSV